MKRAVAGAEREQREGASGKWVAHWKMVHIVRPVWEKVGRGQPARTRRSRRSPTRSADADGLVAARAGAAHRSRRPRSAERRAAVRQRLRPGPAGGRAQAGRLLRQRRRAVPDGRHGDRRDPPQHPVGMAAQERVAHRRRRRSASRRATRSRPSCSRGCSPRSTRSCCRPATATSTTTRRRTTLPIAREIVETYVTDDVKLPWYIDLLNINLDNHDLTEAKRRIRLLTDAFRKDGTRITENLDFAAAGLEQQQIYHSQFTIDSCQFLNCKL